MKRITSFATIAFVLMMLITPGVVFAADSSVSISSGKTIGKGKTKTVIITYKGKSIGFVDGQLEYDSSKLQYVSGGSSAGNAGLVKLKAYSSDSKGKIVFKIKFKGVGAGDTSLKVSTLETTNINGDKNMGTPSKNKAIRVVGGASGQSEASEPEPEETESDMIEQTSEEIAYGNESEPPEQSKEETKTGGPLLWIFVGILLAGSIAVILWRLKKTKR